MAASEEEYVFIPLANVRDAGKLHVVGNEDSAADLERILSPDGKRVAKGVLLL